MGRMVRRRRRVKGRWVKRDGAVFRVRGRTAQGFLVPLRKISSPENQGILEKRAAILDSFSVLVGSPVTFVARKSPRDRFFLVPVISSLPPEFRRVNK